MVLALVAGYARRAIVDSDQFANRATAALRDGSVRTVIAERVTDEVVLQRQADLLAARPLIEAAVSGIVGGGAFSGLFRTAVRDVHRAVFDRDENTVTLTIADVGTVLSAALEKLQPSVARQVRPTDRVEVLERHGRTLGASVADAARALRVLAIVVPLLCLALAAGALWASPDRRRTVAELGVGAACAGVAIVVLLGIVRSVAVREVHGADARAAAGAIWDAFLGDLRSAAWILAACGAIVTAAATSVLRPMDLGEHLRRLADHVTAEQPTTPRRVLRAVALIAAGVTALLARDAVVSLAVTLLGVLLIYTGVNTLLRLVYRPRTPAAAADGSAPPDGAERPAPGSRRRRRLVALAAGGLVIAVVAAFLGTGGATTAAPRTNACNGHVELCDRPLDRVALVATHNAMAVPLPGWFAAEQDRPIAGQLDDGVRGLLIDTHYADRLRNGRLRTYFGSPEDERRQAAQDGVGPEAVDAALRIRERLGFRGEGKRGMYLCHTFCEVGATPLGSVLRDINTFLVTHPDEILVVINQDYVTPEDFVGAVNDAGLGDLVYRGPTDGDWPTLRDMIDTNRADRLPRREPRRRRALVPPGVQGDHGGDAVHVPQRPAAQRPGEGARELPAEAGAGGRAAVPRQPLDLDRPGAEAVRRPGRQRLRAAAAARPALRGDPRPRRKPRRGELLPPGRRVPRGRHAQRHRRGLRRARARTVRGGARHRSSARRRSSATSCSPR